MRLRKERNAAGLTQVQLSRLSGVKQSTISKLEGVHKVRPSFDTLAKLAWALNKEGRSVRPEDLAPKAPLLIKGARALPHKHTGKRRRTA
jgi:transcriptional regulator with XRE-family HTH domain